MISEYNEQTNHLIVSSFINKLRERFYIIYNQYF